MIDLTLLAIYAVPVPGFTNWSLEGIFSIRSKVDRAPLRIIATASDGWDHVSVSRVDRCPDWSELEQVKRLFFRPDETAMQLHVPPAEHINNAEYCLHLWRPHFAAIPRPPGEMVGVLGRTPAETEKLSAGVFHQ